MSRLSWNAATIGVFWVICFSSNFDGFNSQGAALKHLLLLSAMASRDADSDSLVADMSWLLWIRVYCSFTCIRWCGWACVRLEVSSSVWTRSKPYLRKISAWWSLLDHQRHCLFWAVSILVSFSIGNVVSSLPCWTLLYIIWLSTLHISISGPCAMSRRPRRLRKGEPGIGILWKPWVIATIRIHFFPT